jgi:hypothetical protein
MSREIWSGRADRGSDARLRRSPQHDAWGHQGAHWRHLSPDAKDAAIRLFEKQVSSCGQWRTGEERKLLAADELLGEAAGPRREVGVDQHLLTLANRPRRSVWTYPGASGFCSFMASLKLFSAATRSGLFAANLGRHRFSGAQDWSRAVQRGRPSGSSRALDQTANF